MDPTFFVGDTVLYTCSTGEQVLANILGPSSDGAGCLAISYVRNGTMVTHERASVSAITSLPPTSPPPTSPPNRRGLCCT